MLKNLKRLACERLAEKKHLLDLQIWHTFELRKRKSKHFPLAKHTINIIYITIKLT